MYASRSRTSVSSFNGSTAPAYSIPPTTRLGAAAHASFVPSSVNAKFRGPMDRGLMRLFRALSFTVIV